MSDRVAVMIDGELLQVDPPGVLYANPDSLRVAEFVGSPKINVLPGLVATPETLRVLDAPLALAPGAPVGMPVRVGIRSENLAVSTREAAASFAGRVRHVEDLGSDCFVHVTLEKTDAPVVARTEGARAREFRIGAPVWLTPDIRQVLVFDEQGRRLRRAAEQARTGTHA